MRDGPQQLRQHDLAGAEHGADRWRLETDVQHRQGQKVIHPDRERVVGADGVEGVAAEGGGCVEVGGNQLRRLRCFEQVLDAARYRNRFLAHGAP